jgi:3-phosphoshikimate 1-carboxyvinyltransferase
MESLKKITPIEYVSGEVYVPSSKSYAQRAIALAALIDEVVVLDHISECDDVHAALAIIQELGINEKREGSKLKFSDGLQLNRDVSINCGEAGLSTRLFSAFSLLTDHEFTVNGNGSILNRPMDMIIGALQQFGKRLESNQGKLPLRISGQKKPTRLRLDGSISSQALTGFLMVAPFLPFDLTIDVDDLKSKPYIDMTIKVMADFGLDVKHDDYKTFFIAGNQSPNVPDVYSVEGDWSGASFFIVAALIGGDLRLKGLAKDSLQADNAILSVIDDAGGSYLWQGEELIIYQGQLTPFEVDATDFPDLFPPLVALAAMINGQSTIRGVHRLKHKESDRAKALIKEFSKMGIFIEQQGDALIINGLKKGERINGGVYSAHNDHRMAMALALMSLRSSKELFIEQPEAIKKSYPLFFKDFEQIRKIRKDK